MAHLRGHAKMEERSKVGNFVELKKTILGRGSKASHLTYLGDATIGEKTNIGAGTITCNYDGKNKHATEIGNNVKIGSDTMLVAPVRVGDGAVTGAGSVVTKDVPAQSLVVGAPAKVRKNLDEPENERAESKETIVPRSIFMKSENPNKQKKSSSRRKGPCGGSVKEYEKIFRTKGEINCLYHKERELKCTCPTKRKSNYRSLQRVFEHEFLETFGGCTVIKNIKGLYLSAASRPETDKINLIYADTPFEFRKNRAALSKYTDELREIAFRTTDEESI